MTTSAHKTIWWWVTAGCIGGDLLFLLICLEESPPSLRSKEAFFYLWPLCATACAILGGFRLRTLYRREPFTGPGLWQLQMIDLLFVSGFAGILFWSFRAESDARMLKITVPVALFGSAALVAGILTGVRKGLPHGWKATLFGLGWVGRLFGFLGTGALVILLMALFIADGPRKVIRILGSILGVGGSGPAWAILLFRSSLLALPLGFAACRLATRDLPKELPPPLKDDVTSSPPDGTNVGA